MDQEDYLKSRFPNLKLGRKPSALGSVNGFGTTVIGRRDYDAETATYVVTHCATILFIPLIPLGAYRVADAQHGGWYCLGRVPLSTFARGWNVFLVLALLGAIGGIWWNAHTGTPEYAAKQKLKEADRAAVAGQGGQAAKLYREVMEGKTEHAREASTKLAGLIENPPGPPSEAAAVFAVAVDLHRDNRCPAGNPFERGRTLAAKHAEGDPAAALSLLEVIAPYAPDREAELTLRRDLLEKLLARDPSDAGTASRLAVVYEAKGDRERCEKLLTPFAEKLGDRDGAAILGRIYASRGELQKAYDLLRPFIDARIPALHKAETDFVNTVKVAQDRVVNLLRSEKASGFDYAALDRLTDEQQKVMINNYVDSQLKNDASLRTARQQLAAQSGVVSAALDLGLVQLQRAQALGNPAARKAELEAAERTFLSVRGFAGEDDHYRISLGQVYFWLGRSADGKKQFDELLAARGHNTESLLLVANALREVGDTSAARTMTEDAYKREQDTTKKQQVARHRSLMRIDIDDEILWLSRSNTNDTATQAALASAQGNKATQDGNDTVAATHFRQAISLYDKLPDSVGTFNNSALAHFALFHATHDKEEFTRGMDKLDRAIALQATDSILLSNGASVLLEGALRDVASSELDFRILNRSARWDLFGYLYRGAAERAALMERVSRHPGLVKARTYAEKLMTLAPKRDDGYEMLSTLFYQTRNLEGLKSVFARAAEADFDLADSIREYQEFVSGTADAKKGDQARKALTRAETALAAAKPKKGRNFAAAVGRYVQAKQTIWMFGDNVDANELVKLSEEALAASPSDGAKWTLHGMLTFRAHITLMKENAAYAALAKKTQRTLGVALLYYALFTDGALKTAAVANADVKRLSASLLEEFARDPESIGPASWMLIRAVSPDHAAAVREKIKVNQKSRLHHQLEQRLMPHAVMPLFDEYCWLLLDGKDAEAKKFLATAASKGLSLP